MSVLLSCPRCASSLLSPQRSSSTGTGRLVVRLRCAECSAWTEEDLTPAELAELDRAQVAGRTALLETYERCVAESMASLVKSFAQGLERDLLGPDDFAPRRPALS